MSGYPYLDAEVVYAVRYEHAQTAADILCRRTRLAFLNSNAAHLTVDKVVNLMGDELNWTPERRKAEAKACHKVLDKDFLGPVPNKDNASMRAACVADVRQAFDQFAIGEGKQTIRTVDARKIAAELGFPLAEGDTHSLKELDPEQQGVVNFETVVTWWNDNSEARDQKAALENQTIEDDIGNLSAPIQGLSRVPTVFGRRNSGGRNPALIRTESINLNFRGE